MKLFKKPERPDRAAQRLYSRRVAFVYVALRLAVIATMVLQFFNREYESVFLCLLTLVLLMMPALAERKLKIDLPDGLTIVVLLFIFAAEILGEIRAYYLRFPYWDTILHTINGFLCAAIGFALVDLFNRHKRFSMQLSPVYMAVVAFCFSMTIGVIWEFLEFSLDHLLLLDTQKDTVVNLISTVELNPDGLNKAVVIRDITDVIVVTADGSQIPLGLGGYLDLGLIDTMEDLFVNLIGAVVFSVIGYFYVKRRGRGGLASQFIPQVLPDPAEAETRQETPPEETESE